MQKIIDTHIHAWNLDKAHYSWLEGNTSILNRTYAIEEIETERKQSGITAGILVQAANNTQDTDWMLQVAAEHEWIKGVVGWLPLTDPVKTLQLLEDKYSNERYFKGIRHLIHDERDPKWLLQPAVMDSLKILAIKNIPYDVVGVLPEHIETVISVANKVPDLMMVFDHLNQPPIKNKERFGVWGELMKAASQHKNIYAKISGLGTLADNYDRLSLDDTKPYIDFILEYFGVDRCFCGGDWPVSLLAGSYSQSWKMYKQAINELVDEPERHKIFYSNAEQFYDI